MIDENEKAQRAFVKQTKASFVYGELTRYRMVNVVGRLPLWRRRRGWGGGRVERATEADLPRLESFLDGQHRRKAFGFRFGQGELRRRLAVWDGLALDTFLVAKDERGRILGCVAPWSPTAAKVNIVESVPWSLRLARPLFRLPRSGEALEVLYLTHLEIERSLSVRDRQTIFRALLDFGYPSMRARGVHAVSFCEFEALPLRPALEGYVFQSIPMRLFTVRHRDHLRPDLAADGLESPGFEMALV